MLFPKRDTYDGPLTVKIFLLCCVIPYVMGVLLSKYWWSDRIDGLVTILSQRVDAAVALGDVTTGDQLLFSRQLPEDCYNRLLVYMFEGKASKRRDAPLDEVDILVHTNGDANACGAVHLERGDFWKALESVLQETQQITFDGEKEFHRSCPIDFASTYQMEALLTRVLARLLSASSASQCQGVGGRRTGTSGLFAYCDAGPDHTPVLPDHQDLVPIRHAGAKPYKRPFHSLPCHFHTQNGVRISNWVQFLNLARRAGASATNHQNNNHNPPTCHPHDAHGRCVEADRTRNNNNNGATQVSPLASDGLHLYAVPAGRVFHFPGPTHVGQRIDLPHIPAALSPHGGSASGGGHVYLTALSVSPRLWEVHNFLSHEDADVLLDKVMKETRESHRIKRSSTLADHRRDARRTSENGFVTDGAVALRLKKRGMVMMGFHQYAEAHTDGFQVVRYRDAAAYKEHYDYMNDQQPVNDDYRSAGRGTNRFATLLIYLKRPEKGGETVFMDGVKSTSSAYHAAIENIRGSLDSRIVRTGSWEEEMVARCRTRLVVNPEVPRAILFYNQLPDGRMDTASAHGGCPVLEGEKWAANLWFWNAPRPGFPGAPQKVASDNKKVETTAKQKKNVHGKAKQQAAAVRSVSASFINTGRMYDQVDLFFEEDFWATIKSYDAPLVITTYVGNEWTFRDSNGKILKEMTITQHTLQQQEFSI